MKAPLGATLAAITFVAWLIPQARAETFDCRQPASPLAMLVCNDATLRSADAEENDVYDAAILASLDRASLREEERTWFDREILPYNWFAQQHAPIDHAEVAQTYRRRSAALRQEMQAWRKFRHSVPAATLATTCLTLPQHHSGEACEVDTFKPVAGDPSLRYQLQNYRDHAYGAVVVLASAVTEADEWLPVVVASSNTAYFAAPQVIDAQGGKLLVIPGTSTGNAHENESVLYRFEPDSLQEIDDKSWLDTLPARLPSELALSSEIVADYGKMQAVATVTRSQSSCCPTGAQATIDLAIEDNRVVVKGVTFLAP